VRIIVKYGFGFIFVALVLVLSSAILIRAQTLRLDDHSAVQVTCGPASSISEYGSYDARDRDGEWMVMIVPPKVSTECLIGSAKLLHQYKSKMLFEFFNAKERNLLLYVACYSHARTTDPCIDYSGKWIRKHRVADITRVADPTCASRWAWGLVDRRNDSSENNSGGFNERSGRVIEKFECVVP